MQRKLKKKILTDLLMHDYFLKDIYKKIPAFCHRKCSFMAIKNIDKLSAITDYDIIFFLFLR